MLKIISWIFDKAIKFYNYLNEYLSFNFYKRCALYFFIFILMLSIKQFMHNKVIKNSQEINKLEIQITKLKTKRNEHMISLIRTSTKRYIDINKVKKLTKKK